MTRYLFLFITCCFAGCVSDKIPSNGKEALQVTDVQGNTVTLDKPAEKIVCLFDPMVDAIYMLQVQHKLVGIPAETYADRELFTPYSHIDDRVKNRSIATPGSNETANLESIIALKPDLVIVQHMNAGSIRSLQQMGIAVYQASSEKYEHVLKEIEDIGLLTGAEERAKMIRDFAVELFTEMKEAATAVPEENKKTVYFTWANGRIFSTIGRNSMMHDCLVFAGLENVCTSSIDQPNINAETLLSWNPDIIVMWNDPATLFYSKKELGEINAVKHRQIFNLMPMFYYNPHTLKSLCAAVRMKGWGYAQPESEMLEKVKEIIIQLYGPETGNKLNTLL